MKGQKTPRNILCKYKDICFLAKDAGKALSDAMETRRANFCYSNYTRCARFKVYKSKGKKAVPDDLMPAEQDKAQKLISAPVAPTKDKTQGTWKEGGFIIILDDDDDIVTEMRQFLEEQKYQVLVSNNLDDAYKKLKQYTTNLLISDVRMPGGSGIDLVNRLKKEKNNTNCILMTGFGEVLEAQSAQELGVKAFLAKPFKMKELLRIIKSIQNNIKLTDSQAGIDGNFCSLDIEEFISGSNINYPIYVRLSGEKYVRIAMKGEDLASSRIEEYKKKGVKQLYLLKPDYEQYLGMIMKLSKAMLKRKVKIPVEKKVKFLQIANAVIMENVFSNEIDKESFDEAEKIFTTTMSVMLDVEQLYLIIKNLSERSEQLYAHSLSVSMFTVMLTKRLGCFSERNRSIIAMGSLFHDIGKKNISDEILKKTHAARTKEEKKEYEKHCEYGVAILQSLPKVPNEIIQMVHQHHENAQGSGYPQALTKNRIHPFAKLVAIPNEVMMMIDTMKDTKNQEQKFYHALKIIVEHQSKLFDDDYLRKFVSLFKFGSTLMDLRSNVNVPHFR